VSKLESAEQFARFKHSGMTRDDNKTPYWKHLEGVVNRLKNLGITNEDLLCAAWLHDTLEDTDTTFDDIDQRFGSSVAVMVLSLSKDKKLTKKEKERQYTTQIKNATWQAKLVKLCDISSNLQDLKNSDWSKSRKIKYLKKKLYYLNVIKPELAENKAKTPNIQAIIDGINDVLLKYGFRPVSL
jgi:(p)ppGpp synthase/HD superfamily hydrolase